MNAFDLFNSYQFITLRIIKFKVLFVCPSKLIFFIKIKINMKY